MRNPSSRTPVVDRLESRTLFSGSTPTPEVVAADVHPALFLPPEGLKAPSRATTTKLTVAAGTLGQAVTFTATVRDLAALGTPAGTVTVADHGTTVQTLTLTPAASTSVKYDLATATYTIPAGAGGAAYSFGSHAVTATFAPSGSLLASHAAAKFTVKVPKYRVTADKLQVATVVPGTGAAVTAGETADVLYTGYLFKGGSIFDDSTNDGGTPFSFTVDSSPEQVITGFDEGVVGMTVGETRVLVIPPAIGYGAAGSPPVIPANAKLVFLITLEGIG